MNQDQHDSSSAYSTRTATPGGQTVLWVIALLLAVIATTLLVRPSGLTFAHPAFADSPMTGARGIMAFTGQLDKNSYGLFMIDVDARTLWIYQYLPATRRLKLVATRSFDHDRYLKNYNNETPTVEEVKGMLDDQRRVLDRMEREGVAEDDEALSIKVPGLPEGKAARGVDGKTP